MNLIFALRALAETEMPREQEIRCRLTADGTDIHTNRSETFLGFGRFMILETVPMNAAAQDYGELFR
ncbi:hypothetical protein [Cognatishimia maritima]|uniref:Uncharacterized protein n=1 Tax=Cognatishimia maritima TaxID=870908 RepID=A0A1M5VLI0_9RHOB|nr:hypothetical protein [Cognatishimia maritima]SHH76085.1 hypothetical protein SAMN04488044_3217 [Cognatishimia maritima]